ncbi:helix-turn-helix transcriptional regulator [Chitinophaga agrisoli]|uniref:Helix-turn-helix transcriptional regulator n=1 Tax=Chitinophaga agrisoli TaxID=2607653 RepID=A0A5B2VYR6_9BACT|nr:AraC family transcriptional regulator [Chitinophaga agrisoli]KAA2243346.1 helix-turn-helix transcriptional regulator [Chitinophaga agrisoli]
MPLHHAAMLVFNKVYELYDQMGVNLDSLPPNSEFSIYNLGNFPIPRGYRSPVYRANFFSFVFVKNASGCCSSDCNAFITEPGTVYFNNPGHIKQFTMNEVKELYLVTLSESFLKENVHANVFDEFSFILSELVPPQVLPPAQFREFEELYLQIERAYLSGSPLRNKLIGHLFVAILIKIKEYFWTDYSPILEGNRSSQIVSNFKKIMEKHYRELSQGILDKAYRVQEYASQLNLHPSYLNNVIKSKTGRSVSTWITEKTITEAKSLLRYSDFPVKEISYRLGFAESQHFCNYFKKHTQCSPMGYRQGAAQT